MCQEVLRMVQQMDLEDVETQLALQCAPLITGIKISNLLMIDSEKEEALRVILKKTGIYSFRLATTKGKTAFLLFRRQPLESYLADRGVRDFLEELGYEDPSLGMILRSFQARYRAFVSHERKEGSTFPHELGILLGYPLEDVRGFMVHGGRDYLASGYWKVYEDAPRKLAIFKAYEDAKESVIQLLSNDINIRLILEIYSDTEIKKIAG